jgi:hypothetical protein
MSSADTCVCVDERSFAVHNHMLTIACKITMVMPALTFHTLNDSLNSTFAYMCILRLLENLSLFDVL